jgi:two-component system OmpR family response regulator
MKLYLRVGPLELDRIERTVKRGSRKIEQQPRQFRLLEYMMHRADQLLTRGMLLNEVWGYKFVPTTNLVDVHIGHLRRKVDGADEIPLINTIRGAGFILRSVGAVCDTERKSATLSCEGAGSLTHSQFGLTRA